MFVFLFFPLLPSLNLSFFSPTTSNQYTMFHDHTKETPNFFNLYTQDCREYPLARKSITLLQSNADTTEESSAWFMVH
jgi:hypothetical protein